MKIEKYRDNLINEFLRIYPISDILNKQDIENYRNALEKILWMLYNPLGYCEECGHSWNDFSCSCRNCQYDELDIINEPCGNTCVCICDYFDGEPNEKQIEKFLYGIKDNELTNLEKDLLKIGYTNPISYLNILQSIFVNNMIKLKGDHLNDILDTPDPFELYKELLKYNNKILSESDKIKIINLLFLILDYYNDSSDVPNELIRISRFVRSKYAILNPDINLLKVLAQNLLKYSDYLNDDTITLLKGIK